jgi:TetR/AcrR family acrAB operon transcriptional repressor
VTRGAVYWHFKDKAELFFAMREDVFSPMVERTDSLCCRSQYDNPLDAIEASVKEFFRVLEDCSVVREVFEIMISRCEYVDEFTSVQEEVGRPAQTFLTKIEAVYLQAAAKGMLRPGLDPLAMARDTWAFTSGLLHLMLNCQKGSDLPQRVPEMITAHMAIRRVSAVPSLPGARRCPRPYCAMPPVGAKPSPRAAAGAACLRPWAAVVPYRRQTIRLYPDHAPRPGRLRRPVGHRPASRRRFPGWR